LLIKTYGTTGYHNISRVCWITGEGSRYIEPSTMWITVPTLQCIAFCMNLRKIDKKKGKATRHFIPSNWWWLGEYGQGMVRPVWTTCCQEVV
jgi:hypothetical protein